MHRYLLSLKFSKHVIMNNLLYNCETFGNIVPRNLENMYHKLIKAALGVRSSIPNELILIELGLLPLISLIYSRQLKFFKRFKCNLLPNSSKNTVFNMLWQTRNKFLQHYIELEQRYNDSNEIYFHFINQLKQKIINHASKVTSYKYRIYMEFNPTLTPFNFNFNP